MLPCLLISFLIFWNEGARSKVADITTILMGKGVSKSDMAKGDDLALALILDDQRSRNLVCCKVLRAEHSLLLPIYNQSHMQVPTLL